MHASRRTSLFRLLSLGKRISRQHATKWLHIKNYVNSLSLRLCFDWSDIRTASPELVMQQPCAGDGVSVLLWRLEFPVVRRFHGEAREVGAGAVRCEFRIGDGARGINGDADNNRYFAVDRVAR